MARRKLEENTSEKPSAAERTLDMFAEKPRTETPPLGTLGNEGREKAIKQEQDEAIARAAARREREQRALSDQTGVVTQKDIDEALADEKAERDAIQAEGADTSGLGTAFFGGVARGGESPKKEEPNAQPSVVNNVTSVTRMAASEGDEVTYVKGEEMYGKPGQFSNYRVGPFTASTRVLPGETRLAALRRLSAEMEEFMAEERDRAKKAFLAHYPNAFT